MLLRRGVLLACGGLLAGCQQDRATLHAGAMAPTANALASRRLQSRRFDTRDQTMLLQASTAVMQDLGFGIDEARAEAGLIVASKSRDAVEAQQVGAQLLLVLLAAAAGTQIQPVWERDQRIRVALVVSATGDGQGCVARAMFQRVVMNTENRVSRVETIDDPAIYRAFFESLSKSVFLEANEI